jgi:hypothetical protein
MMSPVNRVIAEFLPDRYREEIVGDLIEQSMSTRQMTIELLVSVAALLPMQFQQSKDDKMRHAKWIAAAAILVVGVLQAWDSGIISAPPMIGLMVGFAIGIGIIGLFIENEAARLTIAALVIVLLFLARIMSPVRLPELTLVGVPIFLILVLGPRFMALRKAKDSPQGPGTAA